MGWCVLNFEPDASVRQVRSQLLRDAGLRVIDTGAGDQALCLAAKADIGVIVLDVLSESRIAQGFHQGKFHRIPILHLSARQLSAREICAVLELADAYLTEPFDENVLGAQIRALRRINREPASGSPGADDLIFRSRLLDAIGEAVIATDKNGVIEYWSNAAEQLYGWRANETVGRPIFDVVVGEDFQQQASNIMRDLAENSMWSGKFLVRRKDGSSFWAQVTDTAVRDSHGELAGIVGVSRDITPQIQAEVVLRQSEDRYRQWMDTIPQLAWRFDPKTRTTEYNQRWFDYTGLRPRDAHSGGIQIAMHPEDQSRIEREFSARGDGLFQGEYRLRRASDGTFRWHLVQAVAVPASEGHTQYWFGTATDIERQKSAEAALSESETRFRRLVDSNIIGIAVATLDGVNEANDSFLNMLGKTREDLVMKRVDWAKATPTEHLPRDMRAVEELRKDGICTPFEKDYIRPDGSRLPILIGAAALRNDPLEWICFVVDLRERKEAEAALHESNERLRIALEGGQMGAWSTDAVSGRFEASALANRLNGFLPGAMPTHDEVLSVVHPDDRDKLRKRMNDALSKSGDLSVEYRVRRPEGTEAWLCARGRVLEHRGQRRLFGIVYDITQDVEAHQELERTAAALLRSNQDLEQFAYAVSHDLQEPLRAIAGFSRLLIRRFQSQFDDSARELSQNIESGVGRMQTLINDLLEYSRVMHELSAPARPVPAQGALSEALMALNRAVTSTGVVITNDPLPTLMVEDRLLVQLFQNLVGNAIKYRRENPPRVHISAQFQRDAAEWVFSVRDNGIGFEMEYAERIFGVFQRLHSRDRYPGTGIGLAICKRIVERLGGRIWVESEPGKGSTFYFTLPASSSM